MAIRTAKDSALQTWRRLSGALAGLTALKSGKLSSVGYRRIRGEIFADGTQTNATLVINHYDSSGNVLYADTVVVDGSQAASTWTWDVELRAPYYQIIFTSDGAATVTRAFNEALP